MSLKVISELPDSTIGTSNILQVHLFLFVFHGCILKEDCLNQFPSQENVFLSLLATLVVVLETQLMFPLHENVGNERNPFASLGHVMLIQCSL